MAVIKTEEAATLKLKVAIGTTASGAAKYGTRSISHINPELGDTDFHAVGAALASLQTYPLGAIQKVDTAVLVEEG